MKSTSEKFHDLYLMLGPRFDTLSLRRSNEGTEGFEAFAMKNAQRALEKGFFPDNWLVHYQFSDEQLPRLPLSIERNVNYFRTMLPAINKQGVEPLHTLPLERACLLYDRDKPILATYDQVPTSKVRDFTTSGSNNAPEMLKARPPFNAYNAVEIEQGVLLFTPTIRGLEKLENFLQYTADHFFNSVGVLSSLTMSIHRIPAFNPALQKLADNWPDNTAQTMKDLSSDQVCELFAGKSVLQAGIECHRFNMRPTLENFQLFATPTKHTGLRISRFNADLGHLLHIQKNGITDKLPFPNENLQYTPIPSIESIREVMHEPQVTPRGVEGLQCAAKTRAKDLIDHLFPEFNDTLLNFRMKEKMHLLAEQAHTRAEDSRRYETHPALDMENIPLRQHKF